MHRQQSYLTAGLVAAVCGCSLVIGDIPPAATNEGEEVAMGGQMGTSGSAGERPTNGNTSTGATNNVTSGGGVVVGAGGQAGYGSTDSAEQTTTTAGNAGGQAGAASADDTSGSGGTGVSSGSGGTPTCSDACDCDDDGVRSEACAGDDCDDDNPLVHPGQSSFFPESTGTVGFDYNCDDQSEREFEVQLDCAGLALLGCADSSDAFLGALPPCGESGIWGRCRVENLSCVDDVIDERVMRCR